MNNELGKMKRSHQAVEHAMASVSDTIEDIESAGQLDVEMIGHLEEQSRQLAQSVVEHVETEEAALRVTKRIFGENPGDLERLEGDLRQMHRSLQRFSRAVETLDAGDEVGDDVWRNIREHLSELAELLSQCSEREWAFFSQYSTLLQPGGLSS